MLARDADNTVITAAIRRMVYGLDAGSVPSYYNDQIVVDLDAREIYSYGRHFPLCRYVPRRRRIMVDGAWQTVDSRRPALFVVNGDSWRGSRSRTWTHQTDTRAAIAETGVPMILLPFSALAGAGIDIDSIAVLDVRADTTWTETIERRTIAELPVWRRTYGDTVPRESRHYHAVPNGLQRVHREITADEISSGDYPYAHGTPPVAYAPLLPDADGIYRWSEPIRRTVQPDADGIYRYDESRHRLGDSLFTAERETAERTPAAPFTTEYETRRATLHLTADNGRRHCSGEGTAGTHVAGVDGACIYCASPLTATETYRRRARYLSSFDYNEPAPLYFLCEVPRTGARTVAGAIDSLAPRAVHAAILAGSEVRRQGDIFFIDTPLTTATLAARGATFGRFTLWSRGAKPRRDEVTFVAPDRARDKAIAARELKYARRLWRDRWRALHERVAATAVPDMAARETSRGLWRDMLARHAAERAAADTAGVDHDSPLSTPCACGAAIGEPCRALPSTPDIPERLQGMACRGAGRHSIKYAHGRERDTLERETARERSTPPAPHTSRGARARWRVIRRRHADEVTAARDTLRRATMAPPNRRQYGGRRWSEGEIEYGRRIQVDAVRSARLRLESILARGAVDSNGNTSRRHARDSYRARFGSNAVALWSQCKADARLKYRPETVADANRWRRNRETVRRHLAVYGTAHTATDVARVGSAVYVRGTVRHAVDLEPNRGGAPDHRPIVLTADRWYLAVRNTVPRQTRRRRRRGHGARSATGNNG